MYQKASRRFNEAYPDAGFRAIGPENVSSVLFGGGCGCGFSVFRHSPIDQLCGEIEESLSAREEPGGFDNPCARERSRGNAFRNQKVPHDRVVSHARQRTGESRRPLPEGRHVEARIVQKPVGNLFGKVGRHDFASFGQKLNVGFRGTRLGKKGKEKMRGGYRSGMAFRPSAKVEPLLMEVLQECFRLHAEEKPRGGRPGFTEKGRERIKELPEKRRIERFLGMRVELQEKLRDEGEPRAERSDLTVLFLPENGREGHGRLSLRRGGKPSEERGLRLKLFALADENAQIFDDRFRRDGGLRERCEGAPALFTRPPAGGKERAVEGRQMRDRAEAVEERNQAPRVRAVFRGREHPGNAVRARRGDADGGFPAGLREHVDVDGGFIRSGHGFVLPSAGSAASALVSGAGAMV
ncbi:MAG: hypothetical protein EGQ34_08435 [Sutterella sp.]|nr:hypothetical protein [Sutterella sp.]